MDCSDQHPERITSWTDFATHLQLNFGPVDANQEARDKLRHIHQRGSAKSYVQEFRKLAIEASDIPERELLDWFTQGLKSQLKVKIEKAKCLGHCTTMAQVVTLAEKLDNALSRAQSNDNVRATPTIPRFDPIRVKASHPPMMQRGTTKPRSNGSQVPLSGTQNRNFQVSQRPGTPQCSYCHFLGHTLDECRKRKAAMGLNLIPPRPKVNHLQVEPDVTVQAESSEEPSQRIRKILPPQMTWKTLLICRKTDSFCKPG